MKLLGVGDNVVDRYPQLATMYPGGNAVNVAVFASRLGASASYSGQLGSDEAGDLILDSLQAENVDVSGVWRTEGPNAYADVVLKDGDRIFVGSNRSGAIYEPRPEHFEQMGGYDVVHTGYAGPLLSSVPLIARKSRVSYDFGSRFEFEESLKFAPHLFLAAYSASHLADRDARRLAAEAVAHGANYALVTRGEHGAFLGTPTGLEYQAADLMPVLDTLGAGDAYIASVLVGLLSGRDPRRTLASAASHATQVCLSHGAYGHAAPYDPASSPTNYTNLPSSAERAITL